MITLEFGDRRDWCGDPTKLPFPPKHLLFFCGTCVRRTMAHLAATRNPNGRAPLFRRL
jgi:hypothetical protein